MAREIDEAELQTDVFEVIRDTGRDATFKLSDDTEHTVKITPPRRSQEVLGDSNIDTQSFECLIAARDMTWDPELCTEMTDSKTEGGEQKIYRVIRIEPIDSGLLTQAFKIFLAR